MNIEKMKQIIDLMDELENEGVYGFNIGFGSKDFQVGHERLLNEPELQVEEEGYGKYPYRVYVQHKGFRVFALIQSEQLKQFPQLKGFRKQVLLKQIAELEDEMEVAQ